MFWKGRIPLAALILSLLLAIEISVTSATNDKASEDDRLLRLHTTNINTTNTQTKTGEINCTGYFCHKHLDEIFIVGTHNSLAVSGKVFSPNQNYGLAKQFVDGTRFFNLDLYFDDVNRKVVTSHGPGLVYDPSDQMKELLLAMTKTTTTGSEFVLIQLQDSVLDAERIYQFFEEMGFSSHLVNNFDISKKMGDYIQNGQDVLLVTDSLRSTDPTRGIHYTNDFVTENDYTWKSCYFDAAPMTFRRGPSVQSNQRSFKLMNYFCSLTGAGDKIASNNVNQKHRIMYSAREYIPRDYADGTINGILVDYYQTGDVFEVQDQVRSGGWNDDCWEDGRTCREGTTCWNCCRNSEWWDQKFFTACGQEPCMSQGTVCGKWTTCDQCCSRSADCPWYRFGVCRCK